MKKQTLSIISILLVIMMMLGVFASCATTPDETTTGKREETTEANNEGTTVSSTPEASTTAGNESNGTEADTADSVEQSGIESGATETATGGESDPSVTSSDTDSDTSDVESTDDADNGDDGEDEDEDDDEIVTAPPIDEIDNGYVIENANDLKNGVNAFFTDGKRTDFALVNQNMSLEYALAAGKNQQITSLVNTSGASYIQNTADVFVKLTNGTTLYASSSTASATANLYRLGYYMYEARFEEQNFLGAYTTEGSKNLSLSYGDSNQISRKNLNDNGDGSLHIEFSGKILDDPFLYLSEVEPYAAADYPYLAITMKANIKGARGITIYLSTDSHSMDGSQGATILPSEEYMTYVIPLYRTSWYKGTVTNMRLDFTGNKDETYDIKEIKLLKGDTEDLPEKLGLNRSFFVYSDKLHHVIQIASANEATNNIASVGMETKIDKSTVAKVVAYDKNGRHDTFEGVDWDSAEYVGFDIKGAGIFGYILPAGEKTDKLEVIENGTEYVIIQSRTPENGTILNSAVWDSKAKRYYHVDGVTENGNDFYMGQRIYTDESHDFEKFLLEAHIERNPLPEKSFQINKKLSSYESNYECSACHEKFDSIFTVCLSCGSEAAPIENASIYFIGYDGLRGLYNFRVPSEGFSAPYFQYPNKYIDLTFKVSGDEYERNIYFMASSTSGCLECAAILDENRMMLPIPVEVGKNFSESEGERNLWNVDDDLYGESIIPLLLKPDSQATYTMLNLYQNWGQYPLKQVSWIQFYAPYYHLSTGVTESNCIVPYYSCKNARGLGTLPDHRAMSAHLWAGQPQHTSGGSHVWLKYTDANGVYSASENTLDYIDSYGPIYADVYMDYLSDDGNIKVSYTHMEFPQTDENRAYYEMKYEVLGDVSFKNFAEDFCFYDVGDNDSKGSYVKVGYLNSENEPTIVAAAKDSESFKYTLGTKCPYFSFFDMPDYNVDSTSAEGFTNLSFLIYNYELVINGQKSDARFAIVNENDRIRLTLDLGATTLKKGDTFTINAIVMPWGDENLNYDEIGDKNVRDVRENTLLNPLTATAVKNCEVLDSVFLPKVKSTNGKNATFTLTGGQNNVAVRVYGFAKLTVPVIQELVGDEWVDYKISSAWKPDKFGNAHYYDGYSVHYDEDGSFSYSFIVPMDYTDTDGRTFRVSASESFEGWPKKLPEIEQEVVELPLNVFANANEIHDSAKNQAGRNFGGIAMSPDGTYVTLSSNEKKAEAYFNIWDGDGGKTVTGQYLVLKYRLPLTNNKQHRYFEIFTNTEDVETSKSCFGISNALIADGEWHTLVMDFGSFESSVFKADDNGQYKANFVRIDLYNEYYANGNSIDIEFFGISDNLEDIRAYETVDTINVYTKGGTITTYDKDGNETETPSSNAGSTSVNGFNYYLSASDISDAAISDDGHIGATTLSSSKDYVTLGYSKNIRVESYITLFTGNRKATGQYLIFKYRTAKQAGYIEIYCSTEADGATAAAAIGGRTSLSADGNHLFVADNEWHTVVIDLSKALKEDAFKQNSASEYIAKFVRLDLFNFASAQSDDYSVDVAYLGFSDNYDDAISHDTNTWFYDGEKAINVATGKELEAPTSGGSGSGGTTEDAESGVSGYNVYMNATSLATTGKNTLWKDRVILSSDGKFTTFENHITAENPDNQKESYFTFFSSASGKATGQYVIIKYRSNVQQGSITLWSSTQKASPSSGNNFDMNAPGGSNGLFIADNEWHIVVVDLSKLISTFTPTDDGKYAATHLRVDFFNFDKVRDPSDTLAKVDVAYIGLCDDFTEIITSDKSVSELVFFNGKTYKYSTATGEITSAPTDDPEPEPEPKPEPEPDTDFKGNHFNATTIIQSVQAAGSGHAGNEELIESGNVARIYNCVDTNATDSAREESYFHLLSNNTEETGRYLVIKYRTKHPVGYIQIYSSTVSNSASDGGNSFSLTLEKGLFVANDAWQVVIIDLYKVLANYKPDDNGKYFAKHLRIDLFNFGSPRTESETAYVDIAYIGLSNDLAGLITGDTSVSKASFYDGTLKEYLTATGDEVGIPNLILNATALSGQTEGTGLDRTLSSDGSYLSYTVKSGASDAYSFALRTDLNINAPSAPTGQYLMIKYRTTYTGNWTVYLGANNGHNSASNDGDKFYITQKNGTAGAIISDGEWQYLIIDLASFYESAEMSGFKPENGTTDTYIVDYLRFGFWPSASTPIDIAYVAMADNIVKLEAYGNMSSYTYVDSYNSEMVNETVTVG